MDAILKKRVAVDAWIAGGLLRFLQPLIGFQAGKVGLRVEVVADLHGGATRQARAEREHQHTRGSTHRIAQLRTFHAPSLFLHMFTSRVALT